MATNQELKGKQLVEKARRELKRRSLDQLKVFNPLKTDLPTIYDGFTHVVRAESEATLPRYIAEKWMREYIDIRINEDEQEAVDKENKKRKAKGWKPLNLYEERDEFDSINNLLTSNVSLRTKYMKEIYRGVSHEHGIDTPKASAKKVDNRTDDIKILEQLDIEMGTEFIDRTIEDEDLTVKKDKLVKDLE